MKLLLTNDDGIDAPGLAALQRSAAGLGKILVLAPTEVHSGCSHRVTMDKPLRLEPRGEDRFALHGTPADCVRIGLHDLAADVDWVLAGINAGGNLGSDVHYSGTVAAAREAALHRKPAAAVSQYIRRGLPLQWERSARWAAQILADLLSRPYKPGMFWNINLPHLPPDAPEPRVVQCPVDLQPLPLGYRRDEDLLHHYQVDYHNRPRDPGSDIDVCFGGDIAVSPVVLFP